MENDDSCLPREREESGSKAQNYVSAEREYKASYNSENDKAKDKGKVNWLAIVAFVAGIASFLLGYYFGISSAATVALAVAGLKRENKCGRFNNLAVSALVLGIISFIIWAVVWIALGKYLIYAVFSR